MKYIEFLKLIAETVTAISAAIVVLIHLFKIIPKSIKVLFSKTIPLFIKGTENIEGKHVWGFKAICIYKSNQETIQQIVKAISPEYETEDILVLNKKELNKCFDESKLFTHVKQRKLNILMNFA